MANSKIKNSFCSNCCLSEDIEIDWLVINKPEYNRNNHWYAQTNFEGKWGLNKRKKGVRKK